MKALLAVCFLFVADPLSSQEKPLVFVSDQNYPPVTYFQDGLPKGVWVDLASAVGKSLLLPYTITLDDWSKAQQDLKDGRVDVLYAISYTEERRALFELTLPVSQNLFTFFTKGRAGIEELRDLQGLKVGVTAGGLPRQMIGSLQGLTVTPFETYEHAFSALEAGVIDVFAADRWVGSYILSEGKWPDVTPGFGNFASLSAGFAVRKGNADLLERLNKGIIKLKEDGTFDAIMTKWTPKSVIVLTREQILLLAVAGLGVGILIVLAWLLVMNLEIRRRKKAEDFSNVLKTSFDLAKWGIVISKPGSPIPQYVNREFARMHGYEPSEIIGRLPEFLISPDSQLDWHSLFQKTQELDSFTVEILRVRKNGSVFPSITTVTQLAIAGLPQKFMVANVLDITERNQAEEERLKLLSQLQQSQKMESLGVLAGGIAHDINNVLGAVLVVASAGVENNAADSPDFKAFDTIVKAAERGGKMVKNLLNFSRKSPVDDQDVDVNSLARETVSLLESILLNEIQLKMELAPDLRHIRGDADALNTSVMNLCINAIDAMPQKGLLTLRTLNHEDDEVELQVEDTGTGMSPETLSRALEPFFTTKPVGRGTGLGLPLVYAAVKAHGGRMDIQSQPEKGTLVKLVFPARDREPKPTQLATVFPEESRPRALRVLLVDDDEMIRTVVQELLTTLGHQVTIAPGGEDALSLVEKGLSPELVILDMNMPGLGGTGTLPKLRQLSPEVPVLLSTGRIDQTALDLAANYRGVTLLAKPFTFEDLREKLQQALG